MEFRHPGERGSGRSLRDWGGTPSPPGDTPSPQQKLVPGPPPSRHPGFQEPPGWVWAGPRRPFSWVRSTLARASLRPAVASDFLQDSARLRGFSTPLGRFPPRLGPEVASGPLCFCWWHPVSVVRHRHGHGDLFSTLPRGGPASQRFPHPFPGPLVPSTLSVGWFSCSSSSLRCTLPALPGHRSDFAAPWLRAHSGALLAVDLHTVPPAASKPSTARRVSEPAEPHP